MTLLEQHKILKSSEKKIKHFINKQKRIERKGNCDPVANAIIIAGFVVSENMRVRRIILTKNKIPNFEKGCITNK